MTTVASAHPADDLYPLGLRIAGRKVLVVGAGNIAARRAQSLVDAGADVHVVAPEAGAQITALASEGRLTWLARPYRSGDIDGAWLAHAATGDASVDGSVAAESEAARIFCVVASDAGAASAWVPAVARTRLDDGAEITVAVNAGRDPRRARALRDAAHALVSERLASGELPLHGTRPGAHGSVALVGGGPGDTGLLTVRGRRLIAQADVVVIDRLAPRAVLDDLAPGVIVVDVGKTSGHHPVPQEEISHLIVEHALAGRRVVRLKGGDPYVFGRGGEEAAACRAAGVPVEVVPGVTSAVSVPASVGIPVTHRGLSRGFTVLTGHEDLGTVPAAPNHTVVLLMGVSRLATSAEALIAAGRSPETPVAVVEDGFGPRQRATVGTLATIAERAEAAGVLPPAVTVIGDVVTLAPAWAEYLDEA